MKYYYDIKYKVVDLRTNAMDNYELYEVKQVLTVQEL